MFLRIDLRLRPQFAAAHEVKVIFCNAVCTLPLNLPQGAPLPRLPASAFRPLARNARTPLGAMLLSRPSYSRVPPLSPPLKRVTLVTLSSAFLRLGCFICIRRHYGSLTEAEIEGTHTHACYSQKMWAYKKNRLKEGRVSALKSRELVLLFREAALCGKPEN